MTVGSWGLPELLSNTLWGRGREKGNGERIRGGREKGKRDRWTKGGEGELMGKHFSWTTLSKEI